MAENKITNNKIQITYYSAEWLRYVAREQITNLNLKDFFEILFRFLGSQKYIRDVCNFGHWNL
jgi:hypothetical protein